MFENINSIVLNISFLMLTGGIVISMILISIGISERLGKERKNARDRTKS